MLVLAAALFLSAGSLFWQAWVYLAVFLVCTLFITVYLIKYDPKLLARRLKAGPAVNQGSQPNSQLRKANDMTEADYMAKLKDFEGETDYMYLDSRGNVTIGVGILLASAAAAKSAGITFKNRKTGKAATPAEIEKDYGSVKAVPKGMKESKYEKYTELVATGGLDARLEKELSQAKSDAKSYFPDFDKLPDGAQWALVDMAFNLGGTGLKKYAKMKAALEKAVKSKTKEDWETAAKESHRNGIQSSRNDAIYDWIAGGR